MEFDKRAVGLEIVKDWQLRVVWVHNLVIRPKSVFVAAMSNRLNKE